MTWIPKNMNKNYRSDPSEQEPSPTPKIAGAPKDGKAILKLQASCASSISHGLDAAVVQEASPVKSHLGDVFR